MIDQVKREKRMNFRQMIKIIFTGSLALFFAAADASAATRERAEKKGILLVAFGSSMPEAQAAFDRIEQTVRNALPDVPVRWAYTSDMIRGKLARSGTDIDSPAEALAKMADEGFTHVAVQSLHMIAGLEYHDLVSIAKSFEQMADGIEHVSIGLPMLGSPPDMARAAAAIPTVIPKDRRPDEAVVFVGHGTHHPANAVYAALMWQVQLSDANVFIGTVGAFPEKKTILEQLKAKGIKKAWLMPLMSVAGNHAHNDIAGSGPDSWKSVFEKAGIECVSVLKGTAEFNAFVDIWVAHLKTATAAW